MAGPFLPWQDEEKGEGIWDGEVPWGDRIIAAMVDESVLASLGEFFYWIRSGLWRSLPCLPPLCFIATSIFPIGAGPGEQYSKALQKPPNKSTLKAGHSRLGQNMIKDNDVLISNEKKRKQGYQRWGAQDSPWDIPFACWFPSPRGNGPAGWVRSVKVLLAGPEVKSCVTSAPMENHPMQCSELSPCTPDFSLERTLWLSPAFNLQN